MPIDRATTFKSELTPLPMRVSKLQYERLKEARDRDGLSIQEHVRRSLDVYLAKLERDYLKQDPENSYATASPPAGPQPQGISEALANPRISGIRSRRPLARLTTK